jgi:hypothetical protein
MLKIILLDADAAKLMALNANIGWAAKKCRIKAQVVCIDEPPYLARENLFGLLPAIRINGEYWTLSPGVVPTKEQCASLLEMLQKEGRL